MKYSAFISYNHRDRRWATWLHRKLETYRIPQRLVGTEGALGTIGAKLPPVFRDRDELAASSDLAESVRLALADAATLIVICSPNAVASRWVNEEIRAFTALGRRHRIFCLIVDGVPHSQDPATECLPPALFEELNSEPLAADLRQEQDGKGGAVLKLLAGIIGVPYDLLRQREAARRTKRLAVIATASLIGFLLTTALAISALIARSEAERQRDIARQRTITAERTVDFVKSMFEVADPSNARGATITAREVVEGGVKQIETGLEEEPAVRTELAITLSEVLSSLGLYARAEHVAGWSLSIPHRDALLRARQLRSLADVQQRAGDYERAIRNYQKAVKFAEQSGEQGNRELPRMLVGLGEAYGAVEKTDAAMVVIRQALALDLRQFGPLHSDVARDYEALGLNHFYSGDDAAARPLIQRALAIRLRTEGKRSPSVADNQNTLGSIAYKEGDLALAERYFQLSFQTNEKVLGPDHPDIASLLNNIGRVMIERRNFAGARPIMHRAVAVSLKHRSAEHDDMAFLFANLALAESGMGRLDEGESNFRRALIAARANKHRNTAPIMVDLASILCRTRRTSEVLTLLDTARPIMAKTYPDEPWRLAWLDNVWGECSLATDPQAAATRIRSSSRILLKRWKPDTYFGFEARRRLRLLV